MSHCCLQWGISSNFDVKLLEPVTANTVHKPFCRNPEAVPRPDVETETMPVIFPYPDFIACACHVTVHVNPAAWLMFARPDFSRSHPRSPGLDKLTEFKTVNFAPMSCERCRNIHFRRVPGKRFEEKVVYIHHGTKESLHQSVSQGCQFCIMISHMAKEGGRPNPWCDELDAYIILLRDWVRDEELEKGSQELFTSQAVYVYGEWGEERLDVSGAISGKVQ